ncbi:uncharacterized protein BDZ83DRAFT_635920 [Colletotrichum acutatum]|uniref:Uncharacterized protein n=1 Tax=Glomerella acutata TaxID=27357 RepID=A0AAD8UA09_GLOAC|nr:uncharacterized protein BDZ83DRAFT_635920 [Colletotrichum acutatum]KAK1715068.1 hypothetical protein BDZ83DRAFT_635920 [Colletotrichum acutatum]
MSIRRRAVLASIGFPLLLSFSMTKNFLLQKWRQYVQRMARGGLIGVNGKGAGSEEPPLMLRMGKCWPGQMTEVEAATNRKGTMPSGVGCKACWCWGGGFVGGRRFPTAEKYGAARAAVTRIPRCLQLQARLHYGVTTYALNKEGRGEGTGREGWDTRSWMGLEGRGMRVRNRKPGKLSM